MTLSTSIEISDFGTSPYGDNAQLFTLKRQGGLTVSITNFGGITTEIKVPDNEGNNLDVVLGFNTIDEYVNENIYAGAIVGRIAGRVTGSRYVAEGKTYQLSNNYADYHVHGGNKGLDKRLWRAEVIMFENDNALQLSYFSPDGEEGYHGNVNVTVLFRLTNEGGLRMNFEATTDKPTPLCLTNHSYFNLSGAATAIDHIIQIDADSVIEVSEMLLPTGNIKAVEINGNDFRTAAPLGERLPFLYLNHGDNYLLENNDGSFKKVARISSGDGKRNMLVFTSAPNLQLYTGVGLNTGTLGKMGLPYKKYAGICLECQGFSDAVNHKGFKSIILQPGEIYKQSTEYRFGEG